MNPAVILVNCEYNQQDSCCEKDPGIFTQDDRITVQTAVQCKGHLDGFHFSKCSCSQSTKNAAHNLV